MILRHTRLGIVNPQLRQGSRWLTRLTPHVGVENSLDAVHVLEADTDDREDHAVPSLTADSVVPAWREAEVLITSITIIIIIITITITITITISIIIIIIIIIININIIIIIIMIVIIIIIFDIIIIIIIIIRLWRL